MTDRIFFAPIGTELPVDSDMTGFTEVSEHVLPDGFTALGDAAAEAGRAVSEFASALTTVTLTVKPFHLHPDVYRALFGGWSSGKRARKRFMAGYKRNRKAWRLTQRDAQRAAIGIKGDKK